MHSGIEFVPTGFGADDFKYNVILGCDAQFYWTHELVEKILAGEQGKRLRVTTNEAGNKVLSIHLDDLVFNVVGSRIIGIDVEYITLLESPISVIRTDIL